MCRRFWRKECSHFDKADYQVHTLGYTAYLTLLPPSGHTLPHGDGKRAGGKGSSVLQERGVQPLGLPSWPLKWCHLGIIAKERKIGTI